MAGNAQDRGPIIGLTGGIATGKSTVARMFQELGAFVVSADEMARRAVEPGRPAYAEILAAFGDAVFLPDGALDRGALGRIVFENESARRKLEAITHPRIRQMMAREIEGAAGAGRTVVAEIPLLFESKPARALVDLTVVVSVDEATQRGRLMDRDGLTAEEARVRMASQLPLADKVARADYVVDNGGSSEQTRAQVRAVWDQLHDKRELTR